MVEGAFVELVPGLAYYVAVGHQLAGDSGDGSVGGLDRFAIAGNETEDASSADHENVVCVPVGPASACRGVRCGSNERLPDSGST